MSRNFISIEIKEHRLAIIAIIHLILSKINNANTYRLNFLILELDLTHEECQNFIISNDISSLQKISLNFKYFTKDYLVASINDVVFENNVLDKYEKINIDNLLITNFGFINGEYKRRSDKLKILYGHFIKQPEKNYNSSDKNKPNIFKKILKIALVIIFTSFIGAIFKKCYNNDKLSKINTVSNYEYPPLDSAFAIVDKNAPKVDSAAAKLNENIIDSTSSNYINYSSVDLNHKKYIIAKIVVSKPIIKEGYLDVDLSFEESERYSDIKEVDNFDSETKYRIRDKVKNEFYSNWDYNDVTNCRIIQAKYFDKTYVNCEKARTNLLDIQILDFDSYEEASKFKNGNL